ncbi:hypothetical protein L1049_001699 [Liquidambar formosana]|uniref:Uncharacterized protein n=1 Tax=Liquidambar formosana TaxID=63359 RepID=A0AAP0N5C7_LIQFO
MKPCFLDTVLSGHESVSRAECPQTKVGKTDLDSPRCYPEPVELHISEFSDWLESSTRWNSPPTSPVHWDSLPSSPFAWEFEPVEFVLRQENDD